MRNRLKQRKTERATGLSVESCRKRTFAITKFLARPVRPCRWQRLPSTIEFCRKALHAKRRIFAVPSRVRYRTRGYSNLATGVDTADRHGLLLQLANLRRMKIRGLHQLDSKQQQRPRSNRNTKKRSACQTTRGTAS